MAFSPALALYRLGTPGLVSYANRILAKRLESGKEDPNRLNERRGIASLPRPSGRLVWFHAASVGESLSLLDLIEEMSDEDPDLEFLITTGTRTSAELLQSRMPGQSRHQFIPLDTIPFVRKFLDHWSPDLAVWTESEMWPALITQTSARKIPMVLLNARMSDQSFKRWKWLPGMAKDLLGRYSHIFAQDSRSAEKLRRLGANKKRLRVTGSLKENNTALSHDEDERAKIAAAIETRPLWLAASTHPGEETLAAEAHRNARRTAHRLLLILAPRHPDRGDEIVKMLRDDGWRVGQRSAGDQPDGVCDIYVADTLGEMGLWYRLAPFCFLGGSLTKIGGHNPFEPAVLGSAIIHGPHIDNAKEIYDRLDAAGGAKLVQDEDELATEIKRLIEPHQAAQMAHAAWEVSSSGAEASEKAKTLLFELLDNKEPA